MQTICREIDDLVEKMTSLRDLKSNTVPEFGVEVTKNRMPRKKCNNCCGVKQKLRVEVTQRLKRRQHFEHAHTRRWIE